MSKFATVSGIICILLRIGVWSLRVGSTKWDNVLVLAFVGQTRSLVTCF